MARTPRHNDGTPRTTAASTRGRKLEAHERAARPTPQDDVNVWTDAHRVRDLVMRGIISQQWGDDILAAERERARLAAIAPQDAPT